MAKGSITMRVENLQKLLDQVQEIDEKGRKAVKATVRDVKSRAPGWIAQEVTQVYNIKKSEITPSSGKGAKPKKMAGSIQVRGETIEEMTITYSGRLLTPVHFGMTPKTPPAGKSYTLKMQVVKGQKFQSTRPLRGGTAILHKKTVQNIAYCTKSAFTLAVLSGFLALMRPFFLPNVHKFRCEPSEESLLAPRSHAYTIRTPSG